MFRRTIITILSLVAASAVLAEVVYRWVDETGIVQYSDLPHEGAERIELHVIAGRAPRPRVPTPTTQRADPEPEQAAAPGYQSISIDSPGPEENLWNIGGTLNVSVNLQPALQSGHQVRVHMDGTPQMVTGTSFTLPEIFRGVHNIQVEVIDQTGQLKIRSVNNRFYVHQNTIN